MTDLIVIEKMIPANPADVYVDGGLEPIIVKVEESARAAFFDVSTPAGRKECASVAYSISRSKTYLDDVGKEITEEWKKKSKVVDNERKRARDRLDALKDEIRKPLTDWEVGEQNRIELHQFVINDARQAGDNISKMWVTMTIEAMEAVSEALRRNSLNDFEEYKESAEVAFAEAQLRIKEAIESKKKYNVEQQELALLRAADEERKKAEHEKLIADEAAGKARFEERQKSEGALREANERARVAEAERLAQDAAIKAKAADEARRLADKEHKAKINNQAVASLAKLIPEDKAKEIVIAIAKGEVLNVKIIY